MTPEQKRIAETLVMLAGVALAFLVLLCGACFAASTGRLMLSGALTAWGASAFVAAGGVVHRGLDDGGVR